MAEASIEKKSAGFEFLVGKFGALTETPSLPDICGWLAEAEVTPEEVAPYRTFSTERYTRNRVFRNEFVELLVLGWVPGQASMIHDHDGSHGVVRVFEGRMAETKYRRDEEGKIRPAARIEAAPGMLASVGEPDIHLLESLESEDGRNAITFHVYAPPLKGLHVFEVGRAESEYYSLD
ncbi:MAG: cysteine dioxygenase family protein [Acidobacteria bacterium]|nr:cysteine dioxygenase family protein [Acidobacteriota bacterium]